jgi:hypothetical protein
MYCDLWPYVWLVFKSGFYSRAGYSGARTVYDFSTPRTGLYRYHGPQKNFKKAKTISKATPKTAPPFLYNLKKKLPCVDHFGIKIQSIEGI